MDQQVIIVFIDINSIINSINSNYFIVVINSIINFNSIIIIIGVIHTIDSITIINSIIAINPITIINSILIDLQDLSIRLEQANQTFIRIQINLFIKLKIVSFVQEGLSPF